MTRSNCGPKDSLVSTIWKKLNLKNEPKILVVNAPESFEPQIESLDPDEVSVVRSWRAKGIPFLLLFATKQIEISNAAKKLATHTTGDTIVWIAYPKKSSKNYQCEFDRDTGWASFGKIGFEGVRQVAIDEDWSALRFRRVEFIKSMKRDPKRAISKTGKARTKKS